MQRTARDEVQGAIREKRARPRSGSYDRSGRDDGRLALARRPTSTPGPAPAPRGGAAALQSKGRKAAPLILWILGVQGFLLMRMETGRAGAALPNRSFGRSMS